MEDLGENKNRIMERRRYEERPTDGDEDEGKEN